MSHVYFNWGRAKFTHDGLKIGHTLNKKDNQNMGHTTKQPVYKTKLKHTAMY